MQVAQSLACCCWQLLNGNTSGHEFRALTSQFAVCLLQRQPLLEFSHLAFLHFVEADGAAIDESADAICVTTRKLQLIAFRLHGFVEQDEIAVELLRRDLEASFFVLSPDAFARDLCHEVSALTLQLHGNSRLRGCAGFGRLPRLQRNQRVAALDQLSVFT